uniref:Uncharacterized protein n=1 Tax=Panagrolaimus sp. PS1159 TaxID=55785 RepID=A0AC35FKN3_9BILA
MPYLIPEILFGIGKKLIEDGNLKAMIKFGFSGKESLNVLKNVFASISTIKIFDYQIGIGWNQKCSNFDGETFPKCFLNCIGGNVKNLYIEREINPIFQTIIDKIISKKQLVSFSAGKNSYCSNTLKMDKFLPIFSSTLKDLKIPSRALVDEIIDSLHLKTLSLENCFNLNFQILYRCIKENGSTSKFFSSIKDITIIDKTGEMTSFLYSANILINPNCSLQTFFFNMKYNGYIKRDIQALTNEIKNSNYFPSNVVYTVLSNGVYLNEEFTSVKYLDLQRDICKDFIHESSNSRFHCFHQTFKTANSHDVLFKVLIPKSQKLVSERNRFIY